MASDTHSLAKLAHTLREQTPDTPEREAFLDDLAARIRAGTYEPSADKLAEALLKEIRPSEPEG